MLLDAGCEMLLDALCEMLLDVVCEMLLADEEQNRMKFDGFRMIVRVGSNQHSNCTVNKACMLVAARPQCRIKNQRNGTTIKC